MPEGPIRPALPEDEAAILALMSASLGNGMPRDPAFWRWKHVLNPAGASLVRVIEDDEGLLGLRAMMRWTFTIGGQTVRAVRPVDTATHPRAQRRGLFTRLTTHLLDELAADGVSLVFNTPNEKSRPGYLKLGWRSVGELTVWVRPGGRFTLRGGSGRGPWRDLPEPPRIDDPRAHTTRDAIYLRWRYGLAPTLGYGVAQDGANAVVFRTRDRQGRPELTVTELITGADPASIARCARILRRVVREGPESHALAMAAPRTREAAVLALAGFVPLPGRGPHLVVREVPGGTPIPDGLLRPSGWRLQVGDLEVF